ncbi:deoxyribodipyrimidine photolyase [Mucilaginibacter sp. PPCGB 2223]|uniref:cryptochrome/photolyase family protein n=1 Tax=Mucilaginibacter sp. PPCGB 2223 TaxID=1886027 RepID=UPI00082499BC|nr:deoxyribodipyrimidine photo-lyase [Mucilaginibacter sp. PPCGB 2223]OCX51257.1 deoxyribodipyrimidine photolyase [Mucilaginibacter sp. PPCGB 2223]
MPQKISIFWFRRDLRLDDNAGLYHALRSGHPVLPLFIFDTAILDKLEDKDDARATFIYQTLSALSLQLKKYHSDILVKYNTVTHAWDEVLKEYNITEVYTNHDYEPYARERDAAIRKKLAVSGIALHSYKDQVIFEKNEVVKNDGKPYTVFTPYKRRWYEKLKPFYLQSYPTEKYLRNLYNTESLKMPSLQQIGFTESRAAFPDKEYRSVIKNYAETRDFPAQPKGTSHIGLHLRFGTVSIRKLASDAYQADDKTWLNELIWREFYMMILYHFPKTAGHAFKPEYDNITWRNNEHEFEAWCKGQTGYPLVDAGMRELNATGYMHNRVRMVVASFLSKHLLIDWRWGERYFARKLLDYEMASNVGGWQWAAGSGTDAAPYFRVFNPEIQLKKFDPNLEYVKKWVPEYADFSTYPKPIVEHAYARDRCLKAFKKALAEKH